MYNIKLYCPNFILTFANRRFFIFVKKLPDEEFNFYLPPML